MLFGAKKIKVPVIASPLQSGKSRFVKFGRNLIVEVKEKGIVFASYFCKAKIAWQSNRIVYCILFLALFLSSCEFRSPSLAEQQVLMKKGSFPAGVPSWIATPRAGISSVAESPRSDGMFRRGFTKETSVQEDEGILSRKYEQLETEQLKKANAINTPDQPKNNVLATSPLDRIISVCPKVEKEVTEALQTLALQQRIKKYERLLNQCAESWDLWLWLGKDYEKNKQFVQAGRCYDKVLVINPDNQEAEKLAVANRKFLNSKPIAK